ncbi:MAG TPA: SCO family protein, partial [Acidimicrobiales bacterium]|nr:SCO family protein [Acidimicrobiales bacterium]
TDCPLIAAQLKNLRTILGPRAPIDIVAIAIDPYHEKISDLRRFMTQHHMWGVRDFYYLTGPLATLRPVWNAYGISVTMTRTDKMSVHNDFMFIVSKTGTLRWIIPDDPPSSSAGTSSAVSQLRQLLAVQGVT